jgi:hypothetical protein
MADRFASGLRLGYGPKIQRRPFGFHLAVDTLPSRLMRADRVFSRPFVYASPLRGCGGTFTRKRNALLGAHPKSEARNPKQTAARQILNSKLEVRLFPIVF